MLFLFMSLLISVPVSTYAQRDRVTIDQPSLRKIPLAVPSFQRISQSANPTVAQQATEMMIRALDFTGYFQLIPQSAFIADPAKIDITGASLNFKSWTGVGSELMITGGVGGNDELVEMELRMFDTFKSKLIVGKRYKGWKNDTRRMVHRFCSEVILHLTGHPGIFGSKIAFVSKNSRNKEIFFCEYDGYDPRQFTQHNSISLFPAWSSDGKWIAYTSYAGGRPDIYIRNIEEKIGSMISEKGINITPAWVPGKLLLAATLSFSGDQEIYMLTRTGKIIKQLTRKWGVDVSPTFSPDGSKMAFVSNRSGNPQIWIKDMRTDMEERLTFEGNYNTQPEWSPKGDRIVYSAMDTEGLNIMSIGLDGRAPIQLTHGEGRNESPTWSPDGSLIAFATTREGPSRIYVMTAFGTEQRRLLSLPGEQTDPHWSPESINN